MTIETVALPFSTKEEAISSSILLWKELARTGFYKTNPLILQKFPDLQKDMPHSCPACAYSYMEYVKYFEHSPCFYCPIWTSEKTCIRPNSSYIKWVSLCEGKKKAKAAQSVLQEILTLTAQSTKGEQK